MIFLVALLSFLVVNSIKLNIEQHSALMAVYDKIGMCLLH